MKQKLPSQIGSEEEEDLDETVVKIFDEKKRNLISSQQDADAESDEGFELAQEESGGDSGHEGAVEGFYFENPHFSGSNSEKPKVQEPAKDREESKELASSIHLSSASFEQLEKPKPIQVERLESAFSYQEPHQQLAIS